MSATSKRRIYLRRLCGGLFGLALGLVAAELLLRLVGFGLGTQSAFQPDPYCGARHVPNYRGWHTREGRTWIEINEHGFRDRARSKTKPAGTLRIAVLGDSFSEAFQVPLENTYWSVLERELAAHWPHEQGQVEVLNFGVSGYGTAQELEMLRHYVWDFEPDVVLLQMLASNDIANNSRELEVSRSRPFYTLEDGELVLDDSFLRDPERLRFQASRWIRFKHWFVEHLRLAALIYQLRHPPETAPDSSTGEAGLAMAAFQPPQDATWEAAWTVTDRLVLEIAIETRKHGAQFAVLMANCGIEVSPDAEARQALLEQLGVPDLLYPERRIAQLGEEHGFLVIRLAEPMRRYAEEHGEYLHGFPNTKPGTGHWNERGHAIAGQIAASQMLRMLFPEVANR